MPSEGCFLRGEQPARSESWNNQNSYLLYPDRQLPRFLEKNQISPEFVSQNLFLQTLIASGDESIVRRDVCGDVHFSGQFRNSSDLAAAIGVATVIVE